MTTTASAEQRNQAGRLDAKAILRQTLQYGSSVGITVIASLVSYPVFTRAFSRADYGLMALISNTVAVLVSLSKMGLQHSAVRLYPEYSTEGHRSSLYSTLLFAAASSACLTIALLWLATGVPGFLSIGTVHLLWAASPLILLESLKMMFLSFMRAAQQSALYTWFQSIDKYGILAASAVGIFVAHKGLMGFYVGWVMWDSAIVAIQLLLVIRGRLIAIGLVSMKLMTDALRFGIPLLVNELSSQVLNYSDRYMVAHYMGAEATGLYTSAYNLTMSLQALVVLPMGSVVTPLAAEIWTRNGKDPTSRFCGQVLKYFLMVAVPLLAGVTVLRHPLMIVLASRKYADTARLLPALVAAQMLLGLYYVVSLGLFLSKRTKELANQMIIATLLNMVANIWVIPHFGMMGAAWTTLFAAALLVIFAMYRSVPILAIPFDSVFLLKNVVAAAVMAAVVKLLFVQERLPSVLLGITAGAVTYVVAMVGIDRGLRSILMRLLPSSKELDRL
jgi:O-antigen/teichoic acid export membrane protein